MNKLFKYVNEDDKFFKGYFTFMFVLFVLGIVGLLKTLQINF